MTRLWDSNEFIDDNTLTVNVARLRKKMEQIGLGGKIITKKRNRIYGGGMKLLIAFF